MMLRVCSLAAVVALAATADGLKLEARAAADGGCAYGVFHGEEQLLESAPVAFATGGRWDALACDGATQASGPGWTGLEMTLHDADGPVFRLQARNLQGSEGDVVLAYRALRNVTGGLDDQNQLLGSFPGFTSSPLKGRLSWHGSFVQPLRRCADGTQGGPCVLFDEADPTHGTAVVLSALDHFLETSRSSKLHDGRDAVWVGGSVGSLKMLPAGFEHAFLVSGSDDGISDALRAWGDAQRRWHGTRRVRDITIETLGYQTDNGAQYCFGCGSERCDTVLLDVLGRLKQQGVPVRYLSYQNAWWHTTGSAPWCVSDWDWVEHKVPMGVPNFQKAAGVPLQLYAPYFCEQTKYAAHFEFEESDPTLPTCGGYRFKEPAPEDSRRFYDWFFRLGASYGMSSFEADFMNQNLNCVPRFLREVGAAEGYLDGMAGAAAAQDLSVQWCFASPSALLQTLRYPVVTNLRASFDYYYGRSWDTGASSLLMWALDVAPSTDTFWTSDNGAAATALGGCDKKRGCPEDHGDSGCELHTILAILSTGPVGFSDAINRTDVARITRVCTTDGVLLRPDKPVTAFDAHIWAKHRLLQTFSAARSASPGSGVLGYHVLGHYIQDGPVSFKLDELWPRPAPRSEWLVARDPHKNAACATHGAALASCASGVHAGQQIALEARADPFKPQLLLVVPRCQGGWALLGQVSKYVPTSRDRFEAVKCLQTGIDAGPARAGAGAGAGPALRLIVRGAPDEVLHLSFASPDDKIHVLRVTLPASAAPGGPAWRREASLVVEYPPRPALEAA